MTFSSHYRYYSSCVNWPAGRVDDLTQMVDNALQITRLTFLKHVGRDTLTVLEEYLGYAKHPKQGMTMAGDWHVGYYRSTLCGETVYYFDHSRIEYVFTRTGQMPEPVPANSRPRRPGQYHKYGAALA